MINYIKKEHLLTQIYKQFGNNIIKKKNLLKNKKIKIFKFRNKKYKQIIKNN